MTNKPKRKRVKTVNNLEFKIATTLDEVQQALSLRWKIFGAEGYIKPDRFKGHEFDAYDLCKWTTHYVAKHGDRVVGTLRMVGDSAYGLPCEEHADFHSVRKEAYETGGKVAEASRNVMTPRYRNTEASILLYKLCMVHFIQQGITHLCSVVNMGKNGRDSSRFNAAQFVYIDKLGFEKVAEPFFFEDFSEYALPVVLKPENVPQKFRDYVSQSHRQIEKPYDTYDWKPINEMTEPVSNLNQEP